VATRHATDEALIRARIDELLEAIRAADLEGAKAMYAPDIVTFDVVGPLQRVGVEAKGSNWEDAFAMFQRPLGYEVRGLTITVGGDVAFGHGFARLSGTLKNGNRFDGFWVRATYCLRKVDGRWLVAHDHVSVPLDLESGRGSVNLEPPIGG
jgi:ketosteroid isomerase-like protein